MPTMDYSKLRGRIKECGYTQKSLAEAIEISESHFSQKLTGNYPFTQKEIDKICDALKISVSEIGAFFFLLKVDVYQLLNARQKGGRVWIRKEIFGTKWAITVCGVRRSCWTARPPQP